MGTYDFNIVSPESSIHRMSQIGISDDKLGFNCSPHRDKYRVWVDANGLALTRSRLAKTFEANTWLYPLHQPQEEWQPLNIISGESEAGFWYPEKWELKWDTFQYTPIVFPNGQTISKASFIDKEISCIGNALSPHGGLHPSKWLDPATLDPLNPQMGENENPPVYRNKVRFELRIKPYCERMVVGQNFYFYDYGGDRVYIGYGDFTPIWHAPRLHWNRTNRDWMLANCDKRPYKPSEEGVSNLPSASFYDNGNNFTVEEYADFTWTPKRDWQGGFMGYDDDNGSPHIWDYTREELEADGYDTRFLYELPNIYWDKDQSQTPEHWDWNQWTYMISNGEPDGAGRAWTWWLGDLFWKGWEDKNQLYRDFPPYGCYDPRIEVLTYHWELRCQISYPKTQQVPPFSTSQYYDSEWYRCSKNNYWNSRCFGTLRRIAPVIGIDVF